MAKSNYHTHTTRCRHAVGTEKEYIEAAIQAGYTSLGFSDHTPWPHISGSFSRMDLEDLPGYIATVRQLKEEYKNDIRILLGLECEYFPDRLSWLQETAQANGVQYLIFGNHFDLDELTGLYFGVTRTKEEIRRYVRTAIDGMQTGLYAWLAHPDLFLRSYRDFDEAVKQASLEIIRAAKALNMPLEYNLLGLRAICEGRCSGIGYPAQKFWELAAQEGAKVIMNVDAHQPDHFTVTKYWDMGKETLKALGMTRVDFDHDLRLVPVEA